MKNNINHKLIALIVTALGAFAVLSESALADVYWNGGTSSDWSLAANWTGGLPSIGGAGNAIVNPGSPFATPVVSTAGNTTAGQIYISIGAGLDVVSGGQLSTSDLITGNFGNSAAVSVSGGALFLSGLLNIGAAGYLGDVNISGGSVTSGSLSINTTAGAKMDISGSVSFITASSQLGNVNYWIANNAITANGGAPGWTINVDTTSQVNSLILTAMAVPEPSTLALFAVGVIGLLGLMTKYRRQNRPETNIHSMPNHLKSQEALG